MPDRVEDEAVRWDVLLETVLDGPGFRSPEATVELLCRKVTELLGCAMTAIRVPVEDGTTLVVSGLHGDELLTPAHARSMRAERLALGRLDTSPVRPGPRPPSAEAFLTGRAQVVAELADPGDGFPMHAMTVVPLVRRGRTTGVLACYWLQPHRPSAREERDLGTAARSAAYVLEVSEQAGALDRAGRAARTDAEAAQAAAAGLGDLTRYQADVLALLTAELPDVGGAALSLAAERTGGSYALVDATGTLLARAGTADLTAAGTAGLPVVSAGRHLAELRCSPAPPEGAREALEFTAGALAVDLERRARERTSAARPGALRTLLDEEAPPVATADAAAALGISPFQQLVLLLAEFTTAEDAYRCARALDRDAAALPGVVAVSAARRQVVLLRDGGAPLAPSVPERIARFEGCEGIGSSEPFTGPPAIPARAREAATAARIARIRGGPVSYAEIGPMLELTSSVPADVAAQFVDEVLGPLDRYDRDHGTQLTATLATYLACSGSPSLAGSRLHVHVNTVKQRLDRIMALLDCDLREYATVGRVLLALEWRTLLRGAAG